VNLLQAVTHSPAVSLETIVTGFAGLAAIAFWREMRALRDDFTTFRSTIHTALFGPEGNNGINGTVKDHETRLREGGL
jgi:hypothetical protein